MVLLHDMSPGMRPQARQLWRNLLELCVGGACPGRALVHPSSHTRMGCSQDQMQVLPRDHGPVLPPTGDFLHVTGVDSASCQKGHKSLVNHFTSTGNHPGFGKIIQICLHETCMGHEVFAPWALCLGPCLPLLPCTEPPLSLVHQPVLQGLSSNTTQQPHACSFRSSPQPVLTMNYVPRSHPHASNSTPQARTCPHAWAWPQL